MMFNGFYKNYIVKGFLTVAVQSLSVITRRNKAHIKASISIHYASMSHSAHNNMLGLCYAL